MIDIEAYSEFPPGTVIRVMEGGLLRISNKAGRSVMQGCQVTVGSPIYGSEFIKPEEGAAVKSARRLIESLPMGDALIVMSLLELVGRLDEENAFYKGLGIRVLDRGNP